MASFSGHGHGVYLVQRVSMTGQRYKSVRIRG